MGLLIAAALGVIVFLLVEGSKANASTSPGSPVTGAAGAPSSSLPAGTDLQFGPIPPFRPSQQAFDDMLAGKTVDLTQLSPAEQANFAALWQQYNGS